MNTDHVGGSYLSTTRKTNADTYIKQPDTFSCFSRLPVELQRLIWFHTLPAPRVVEVTLFSVPLLGIVNVLPQIEAYPAALQICQNSRDVALSHYTLFSCRTYNSHAIWLNVQKDTVMMTANYFDSAVHLAPARPLIHPHPSALPSICDHVKVLAADPILSERRYQTLLAVILTRFRVLEHVYLREDVEGMADMQQQEEKLGGVFKRENRTNAAVPVFQVLGEEEYDTRFYGRVSNT